MDTIAEYKQKIIEADQFIRQLDESIRQEAFRLLMGITKESVQTKDLVGRPAVFNPDQGSNEDEGRILQRIGADAQISVDRMAEIFAVRNFAVEVIDSSIANNGPVDLLKRISLLCTYGNVIGKGIAKLDVSVIYKNLKDLNASTTAYSRDVKRVDGIKVLSDGMAMLTPEGRAKAKEILRTVLRLDR